MPSKTFQMKIRAEKRVESGHSKRLWHWRGAVLWALTFIDPKRDG
jgi:hypothetical protein